MMLSEKELSRRLKAALKPARYLHTVGVANTAAKLARRHGLNEPKARLAGWLHDCGKALDKDGLKSFLGRARADAQEQALPALWHAPVGAWMAEHIYGCKDKEILMAVRYHSTGAPGQTPLQKLLFVADYIEPNRPPWAELPLLRSLAGKDLDQAWAQSIKYKLVDLLDKERLLHKRSIDAYHSAFGLRQVRA